VVLNFNYDVIQLNQLNWRDFVQQANPVASALMAKMNIADSDRPKVKLECLRLLATLRLNPAKMQLISGFIDSYLELNAQEKQLFQSEVDKIEPTQKEATMKIVTSWMRDGMQSEALSLVMRQLTRKIGTLTPELQQRIEQLQLAQLEDLAEELLDFSEVADLEAWLQRISIGK
jgi:DNA gyrase/topoisomerase IV subunit B